MNSGSRFIAIDNNKVLGVFDGELFGDGRNCLRVPDECPIQQGQDIREYNQSWELRPLAERVTEGLVKIDPRLEVFGETVRPKSFVRLILDGIEELPPGMKMVPAESAPEGFYPVDGYAIVPLTPYELMAAGKIDRPAGTKLVEDPLTFGGYRLEPMTPEERVAAGELTEAELGRVKLVGEAAMLQENLDETDWYVTRFIETGVAVPVEVAAARQAARERISAIRAELAEPVEPVEGQP